MDKKDIKLVTSRHYQKLTQYIKGIIPGLDPEMIHQFRVEYKKLRAFLRMISGDVDLKISRNLKKGILF
jgi:CHAD domain-containing protein